MLKDYTSESIRGIRIHKKETRQSNKLDIAHWGYAMLKFSKIEVYKKTDTLSHRVSTFIALFQFQSSVEV